MARPETLQLLPKPRGQLFFPLLALVAFALLLQGRGGLAASLQGVDGASPMAKIYPRGSHWAVGHFMGKKSTGDFPYIYEDRQEMPFPLLPDNAKQLGSYLQQDESLKELLKRMEEDDDQNTQVLQEELPFSSKNVWGTEQSSNFKDMVGLLLQVLDKKESTPS
ncbi:gastrin-releasing peptide [Ahaetulla prasina]|uniref:gastrin-releasing peptide n=1 Tax=Ahaetulla prasina TaxID=499056 RepID=UPI0026488F9E|nr:gastrin-releasing peptide [Ahaetulla prasina]